MSSNIFLEVYQKAHNNAIELLKVAELLFKYKKFPSSYFLAYTALEEISKSQFAADVFTGMCTEEDFREFYTRHKMKIQRMEWAHLDANSYPYNLNWIGPDVDDVEEIDSNIPIFQNRLDSIYVDVDFDKQIVSIPLEKICEEDAKSIIHLVNVALQRILEITEFHGGQIGTKGFMK